MCAAEIVCPDKFKFTVPKGRQPLHIFPGAYHLPLEAVNYLRTHEVFGTDLGFDVQQTLDGEIYLLNRVTPTSIISTPPGHENELLLKKGNVLVVPGGVTVKPVVDAPKVQRVVPFSSF